MVAPLRRLKPYIGVNAKARQQIKHRDDIAFTECQMGEHIERLIADIAAADLSLPAAHFDSRFDFFISNGMLASKALAHYLWAAQEKRERQDVLETGTNDPSSPQSQKLLEWSLRFAARTRAAYAEFFPAAAASFPRMSGLFGKDEGLCTPAAYNAFMVQVDQAYQDSLFKRAEKFLHPQGPTFPKHPHPRWGREGR